MGCCYIKFALHSSADLWYMTAFIKCACSSDPRKHRRRVRDGKWQSRKHVWLVQADSKAKDAVLIAPQISTKLLLSGTAPTVPLTLCCRRSAFFVSNPKPWWHYFGLEMLRLSVFLPSKTFTIPYCACKTNQTKQHSPRTNQLDVLQKL